MDAFRREPLDQPRGHAACKIQTQEMRSAELLRVVSFDKNELHLETANSGGADYGYVGTLSADGNHLAGSWQGGGGTLNAESNFHRVTQ